MMWWNAAASVSSSEANHDEGRGEDNLLSNRTRNAIKKRRRRKRRGKEGRMAKELLSSLFCHHLLLSAAKIKDSSRNACSQQGRVVFSV